MFSTGVLGGRKRGVGAVITALLILGVVRATRENTKVAGDPCAKGTAVCIDGEAQLACNHGKLIETPCRGPEGCRHQGDQVLCDVSGNEEGDHCAEADEGGGACTADKQSLISCERGVFRSSPCRGPDGCVLAGARFTCDQGAGVEGDPCDGDHRACSVDGKRMLLCKDGALVVEHECRGPDGCKVAAGKVVCDTSLGRLGDSCANPACSFDRTQVFRCEEGRLVVGRICRGKGECHVQEELVRCDDIDAARLGDPCQADIGACAPEGDAVLVCKDGGFVLDAKCPCLADADGIRCKWRQGRRSQ